MNGAKAATHRFGPLSFATTTFHIHSSAFATGPRTRSGGSTRRARADPAVIRKRLGDVPPLKEFVRQVAVRGLYRDFLRVAGGIPDADSRSLAMNEVRTTFHKNASLIDGVAISLEIAEVSSYASDRRNLSGTRMANLMAISI